MLHSPRARNILPTGLGALKCAPPITTSGAGYHGISFLHTTTAATRARHPHDPRSQKPRPKARKDTRSRIHDTNTEEWPVPVSPRPKKQSHEPKNVIRFVRPQDVFRRIDLTRPVETLAPSEPVSTKPLVIVDASNVYPVAREGLAGNNERKRAATRLRDQLEPLHRGLHGVLDIESSVDVIMVTERLAAGVPSTETVCVDYAVLNADNKIVRLVQKHSLLQRRVVVVTDDRGLRARALQLGSSVLGVWELLTILRALERGSKPPVFKSDPVLDELHKTRKGLRNLKGELMGNEKNSSSAVSSMESIATEIARDIDEEWSWMPGYYDQEDDDGKT